MEIYIQTEEVPELQGSTRSLSPITHDHIRR